MPSVKERYIAILSKKDGCQGISLADSGPRAMKAIPRKNEMKDCGRQQRGMVKSK
jgi:hypothetical protein